MSASPEHVKYVMGLPPTVGPAGVLNGAYISVKNAHRVYVIFMYRQGDGTAITFRVDRATVVAGTDVVVTASLMPIWSNLDTATSDLLVARTAAINYAAGTGQTFKLIIAEVDPAALGDYDVIRGATTTAVAATSWLSILYVIEPRYPSRVLTQPTVVTD